MGTITVLTILCAVLALAVGVIIKDKKSGKACTGNCATCCGCSKNDKSIEGFAEYLSNNFNLDKIEIPQEYSYSNLPLCLIDAVFSIGVTYTSTHNTVIRYCKKANIQPFRTGIDFPPKNEQHTISDLIKNIENVGIIDFATDFLQNSQRTSAKNGILKAEAVLNCAKVLQNHQIETLQDFTIKFDEKAENDFKKVKGQSSGISSLYLKMLVGNTNYVKPDRHIINFLNAYFDREIDVNDVQLIMTKTVELLRTKHKNLNARNLDYLIWSYMSNGKK